MKLTRPLLTVADLDEIEARYSHRHGEDAKLVLRLAGDLRWALREAIDAAMCAPTSSEGGTNTNG